MTYFFGEKFCFYQFPMPPIHFRVKEDQPSLLCLDYYYCYYILLFIIVIIIIKICSYILIVRSIARFAARREIAYSFIKTEN